jgi:hypothetical protein
MIILTFVLTQLLTLPVIAQQTLYEIKPTYPDYSRPYGTAGSHSNPYQIREGYDGSVEIRTKYPDYNQPYGVPGSPSNPYKVVPVR